METLISRRLTATIIDGKTGNSYFPGVYTTDTLPAYLFESHKAFFEVEDTGTNTPTVPPSVVKKGDTVEISYIHTVVSKPKPEDVPVVELELKKKTPTIKTNKSKKEIMVNTVTDLLEEIKNSEPEEG